MADKNPYSPIVIPPEWNGRPKNFAMQVKQHISNIYLRLRKKLGKIDSSLATPGNFISIDDDWNLADSGISPSDLITSRGVEIPDDSDLNDYKSYGVFYTQNAAHTATLSNVPLNTAGIKLIVTPITNENWLLQICIFNMTNPPIYMRSYRNGTWSAWTKNIQGTDLANNLTTTDEGYALDARQGKTLDEKIYAAYEYTILGSFSTQAELDAALTTYNSGVAAGTRAYARVSASAAFGLFVAGTSYFVDLSKGGTDTYSSAIIMPIGGDTTIRALKNASGWQYSLVAENDNVITYKATLPTGTNFNNVRDIGMYYVSSSYTYTNKPNNDTYMLIVYKTSSVANSPAQMAFGARKVYVRMASSATAWNAWHSIDNYGEGWQPTNTDLNDVLLPGTYGLSSSNTYLHGPTSGIGGVLEVFAPSATETYVIQRISNGSSIYVRYRVNSLLC